MPISNILFLFAWYVISDPPRLLEEFAYDNITVKVFFDIMSNMTFEGVSVR